jgi:hypothetical protein
MVEDNKCAPTKKYNNGSCFTIEDLKKISIAYNLHLDKGKVKGKKIDISDNKKSLLKQLTKNLENVCDDQICWLKQDFIKKMKDKNILNYTFRPDGPEGKFEWLNTLHINDVMEQYEKKYDNFKFFGAVPIDFDDLPFIGIREIDYDELFNSGVKKLGFVFNLDEHWQSGSHWVALFSDLDKNQIYFFDSYGIRPEKRIRNLVERISKWCYSKDYCKNECSELNLIESFMNNDYKNKIESKLKVEYNHNRHQFKNSECGVYSLNFILRLLNGESFENITKNGLLDDDVNLCRDVYFKFKKNPFNN